MKCDRKSAARKSTEASQQTRWNHEFEKVVKLASDNLKRKRKEMASLLCEMVGSAIHYHIRWHPAEKLDWECFSTVEAAEARVKEIRLSGETFTIEPCGKVRLQPGSHVHLPLATLPRVSPS